MEGTRSKRKSTSTSTKSPLVNVTNIQSGILSSSKTSGSGRSNRKGSSNRKSPSKKKSGSSRSSRSRSNSGGGSSRRKASGSGSKRKKSSSANSSKRSTAKNGSPSKIHKFNLLSGVNAGLANLTIPSPTTMAAYTDDSSPSSAPPPTPPVSMRKTMAEKGKTKAKAKSSVSRPGSKISTSSKGSKASRTSRTSSRSGGGGSSSSRGRASRSASNGSEADDVDIDSDAIARARGFYSEYFTEEEENESTSMSSINTSKTISMLSRQESQTLLSRSSTSSKKSSQSNGWEFGILEEFISAAAEESESDAESQKSGAQPTLSSELQELINSVAKQWNTPLSKAEKRKSVGHFTAVSNSGAELSYQASLQALPSLLEKLPASSYQRIQKRINAVAEAEDKPLGFDCTICFDPITGANQFKLSQCGHAICRECIQHDLISQIERGLIPLRCPLCQADGGKISEITQAESFKVLPHKYFQILLDREMDKFLQENREFYRCTAPDCPAIIELPSGQTTFRCPNPNCKKTFCTKCNYDPHPKTSCQEAKKARKDLLTKDEKHIKRMIRKHECSKCPNKKCGLLVFHASECYHMKCPQCTTHFCFYCSKEIDPSQPLRNHFLIGAEKPTSKKRCPLYPRK